MSLRSEAEALAAKIDDVYDAGYEKGKAEGGVDFSLFTDLSYMFYNGARHDLLELLKYSDTNQCQKFTGMFSGNNKITEPPLFDTSNGTDFSNMFYQASKITKVPAYDVSKATNLNQLFLRCSNLTEVPRLDTSNATVTQSMFGYCVKLVTVEGINMSKATSVGLMFANCTALENIVIEGTISASGISVTNCEALTVDSLMSFINALVDNSGTTTTKKITFGTTNLAKLTEEQKAIMDAKGWTYS